MGEVQGCVQLQCDWFHCHMDTRATEHMYSRGGEKRILDTLSPPGNPPLQRGLFFFLEAQGLLEIVMMKAGFLPWLPVSPWTIYLDVLKGLEAGKQELLCLCSESVDVSQLPSGTHMPKCPCAEEILCFRRLQILFYRSDSSSRSYCPSKKAHTCGQTHAGVSAMQLPFPYLSVCPPLVRVKLRC